MRTWKFCAVALATGLVAATAAHAEDYTDTKQGFRVTIPQGWTQTKDDSDDFTVTSPNTKTTFGFCWVHVVPAPGTETLTQAEIDQRLTGKFPAPYWQTLFEEAGMKSVAIEASGEEKQNGRNTHYAVVTHKMFRRDHKFKTVVHFVPGRAHHLTCDAYAEAYAREEPAFEAFFDSFVPLVPDMVAMSRQPSARLSAPVNTLPPDTYVIVKQLSAAMGRVAQQVTLSLRRDR